MPDQTTPDTLPQWLHQRFAGAGQTWDAVPDDDRAYWAHHAAAVRRAVERGGFKTPEPTEALSVTRTSAEIYARAQSAVDMFGFARNLLLPYCDYETVLPLLNDGVTAEDWAKDAPDAAEIGEAARSYYEFALGKVDDERGISAERSVIKLTEYAWLMGRDDVVAAMDAAPYPPYGAPKVAVFGKAFGFDTEAGA